MAKYRGPRLRIVRRLGRLPGLTRKVPNKSNPPGQHGAAFLRKKLSQFNIRLREKQKLRYHYGVNERQLLNYIKKARKKKGSSGRLLLTFLEMRLDNLAYRLGFAPTIIAAKQLINHGHLLVNGSLVNVPSFACKPNTIIRVKNSLRSQRLVKRNFDSLSEHLLPPHLSFDSNSLEGKVTRLVHRKAISLLINELLVVEYYSRKL